jgi:predicted site-specific integrase-resolvase
MNIDDVNLEGITWSRPLPLTKWADAFGVHRNTLRKWFRRQAIRNKKVSDRRWRVHIEDMPADHVMKCLVKKARE